MTVYGVTPTGFVVKRLQDILNSLNAACIAAFGADFDTDPDKPNGQINGIMAEVFADLWQELNAVYDSKNPDAAFGISLTNIGVLNYLTRQSATHSTVAVTFTGATGTFIPAAIFQATTTNPVNGFHLLTDLTIPTGGTVTVQMEADNTGPVLAPAGTLTTITTPISGLISVTNPADAVPGFDYETDPEFRIRRYNSTALNAQQSEDALTANLLAVAGVIDTEVFVNMTNTTDSNGLQPHSVAVVIIGGEDMPIAQAIYDKKTSSIPTNGTTQVVLHNTAGLPIPINFYRSTQRPVYITIVIQAFNGFPPNGQQQIQQNVFNYLTGVTANGNPLYGINDSIVLSQLYTPINYTPGVGVLAVKAGFSPNPIDTDNLPIGFNENATFNINNIVVTSV